MSNIYTYQVRIVLKPNMMLTNLEDIVNILLANYRHPGRSYIPFHIQHKRRIVDIQFGTNGGGYAYIKRVWEIFGIESMWEYYVNLDNIFSLNEYSLLEVIPALSPIASIWVRETDEGAISDKLYVFDSKSHDFRDAKKVTYAFDTVTLTGAIQYEILSDEWKQVDSETWVLKRTGVYLSNNSRIDNPTPIPLPENLDLGECEREIDYVEYPPLSRLYEMPDFLTNIEVDIWKQAETLEFYYRERLVRKFQRCSIPAHLDNGWIEINLDYWDNCVNPEWLAYKQEIGLEE